MRNEKHNREIAFSRYKFNHTGNLWQRIISSYKAKIQTSKWTIYDKIKHPCKCAIVNTDAIGNAGAVI